MPGMFKGGSGVQPGQPTPFQNFAITAAPMFSAMAAGYSSGRGPYAYMDQGLASMQARAKEKRDQEAAAAASAAFAGLVPGGNGSASYGTKGGYSGKGIWAPTTGPIPKADVGVYGGGKGGLSFGNLPAADTGVAQGGLSFAKPGGNELPDQIYAGLIARGHSPVAAHGIMMNLQDESAFNLGAVGDGGNAFGLAQWNGPRKRQLEAFAASQGKSPADLDVQLDFLTQELQGPEAAAGAALAAATTPGEAGAAFVNMFERPAEEHRSSREAKYLAYSGGSPEVTMSAKGEDSLALGAPPDPLTDPYVQQLMQVLAMPGLTPQQQAVVQLQLEGRMKTLTTPQPGAEEEAARARRARDAELLGYGRGTPEWNQYVVTGEMPAPPEPGFTQLAPQEVQALGLPPGVYQKGPDGRIDTIEKTQGVVDPIADLKARAMAAGLKEGTPEYQQFMLNNGKTPEGMVIESDGQGGFRMVQGAGAAGAAAKPFTEAQGKDVVFATRAKGALETLDPIAGALASRGEVAADWLPMGLGGGLQSDEYQVAKTAGDEFLQAILRKDTGAAITPAEQALYGETYLPRPGDSEARLQYKAEARQRAVAALEAGMSPAQIVAQEKALAKGSGSVVQPESATNADGWQTLPNGVKVRVKQ